jgi:phage terminase large subunit
LSAPPASSNSASARRADRLAYAAALAEQVRRRDVRAWAADPEALALAVLGLRCWSRQAEILRAVAEHPRVAVRSGHKVGKTEALVILALWWVLTRPRAQVVLSASVGAQLENILWPALRRIAAAARAPLGGECSVDFHRGLRFPDGRHVFGLKPEDSNATAFAGHQGDVLFLIDEASGFSRALLDAALGAVAAGGTLADGTRLRECRIVLAGNPLCTSGPLWDAFHDDASRWHGLHIDSRESPNITGAEPAVPGLATREWLQDMLDACGGDDQHPLFAARVAGQFPGQGANAVLDLALVEAAGRREVPADDGPLALGVDVARFGDDDSVVAARRGRHVLPLAVFHGLDGPGLAAAVLQVARRLKRPGEVPRVKVDVIGVGSAVYDCLRLATLAHGDVTYRPAAEVVAVAVDVATRANDPERYTNRRAECWFGLRTYLADASLPADPQLAGDLVAPAYLYDAQGRYQVEAKEKLKQRLKRSPDRAEALMLAVCDGPAVAQMPAPAALAAIAARFRPVLT